MNNLKTNNKNSPKMLTIPETVVLNTKGHKILSPEGLVSFFGINKISKDSYIHLKFSNGKELKCSPDHPLMTIDGIVKAKDITKKEEIQAKTENCFVVSKRNIKRKIELYDIVNSGTKNLYYSNDIVSHNCSFLGSVDTLISASKLRIMPYEEPLTDNGKGLKIYENPKPDRDYIMTVDVSRGTNNDYSAFIVVDITTFPWIVVAKYRNNEIKPMLFPNVIEQVAKTYNKAYILVEINDIGEQVGSTIHFDLEYPNLLMCSMRGRAGQTVGQGFSGTKSQFGLKMSKVTKKIGCSNLKTLIEDDKLLIYDYDIISELTTFIQKNNGFEADEGYNDDLVMCLVLFAWLAVQPYFKEMTENDVRKRIYEEQKNQIEQDLSPIGFLNDGLDTEEEKFLDEEGNIWYSDEYGNPLTNVEYKNMF